MHRLKTAQRGLRNLQGASKRKLAVTTAMLMDIHDHANLDGSNWDDVLAFTAILVGFFFLLRSVEYLRTEHGVDPKKCIKNQHVSYFSNGVLIAGDSNTPATRVVILVPFSKTDAEGVGVELEIDIDSSNPLCPVKALNRLRAIRPQRFSAARSERHAFTLSNGRVLDKGRIHSLLRGSAGRLGFNPDDFTSHSLRAGGASAMYHNHFTIDQIKRRGRWSSDVWKIYVQGLSETPTNYTQRMTANATLLRPQRMTGVVRE